MGKWRISLDGNDHRFHHYLDARQLWTILKAEKIVAKFYRGDILIDQL